VPLCGGPAPLTAAEVETILAQAADRAAADGNAYVLTVVNRDGAVVGAFAMAGVPAGFVDSCRAKARTAAFLSSNQHAFSTRTARFIIQDNFPLGLPNTPGGPLYGVQFSSLACSDVVGESGGTVTTTGNGLSGDFGSVPLHRSSSAGLPPGRLGSALLRARAPRQTRKGFPTHHNGGYACECRSMMPRRVHRE